MKIIVKEIFNMILISSMSKKENYYYYFKFSISLEAK